MVDSEWSTREAPIREALIREPPRSLPIPLAFSHVLAHSREGASATQKGIDISCDESQEGQLPLGPTPGPYVPLFESRTLIEGEGRAWQVDDRHLAIFKVDGVFYAIDNTCPHAGAPLCSGHLEGAVVYCPMHLWRFDLRTGECLDVATAKINSYPVVERNGTLWVCLAGIDRRQDSAGEAPPATEGNHE